MAIHEGPNTACSRPLRVLLAAADRPVRLHAGTNQYGKERRRMKRSALSAVFVVLGLATVLVLAGGCRRSSQQAALRCGGGGLDLRGLTTVVAGADNEFFTATARQSIKIKPGVDVKAETDSNGKIVALRMVARQNTTTTVCGCPAGCSGSCSLVLDSNDPKFADCVGDCVQENACCFGCGLYTR